MELRMQYAKTSDGVRIAFGTAGRGPWLIRVPSLPFSHAQLEWASGSEFFDELAANWTVVQYDPRGTGLSDRNVKTSRWRGGCWTWKLCWTSLAYRGARCTGSAGRAPLS